MEGSIFVVCKNGKLSLRGTEQQLPAPEPQQRISFQIAAACARA